MSDNHQAFEQIQETLEAFQAHSMSLADLIERVPGMVKTVSVDATWKDEFVGYWWTLEQVHEEAIELGEGARLPDSRREAVDIAILSMQKLVDTALVAG